MRVFRAHGPILGHLVTHFDALWSDGTVILSHKVQDK